MIDSLRDVIGNRNLNSQSQMPNIDITLKSERRVRCVIGRRRKSNGGWVQHLLKLHNSCNTVRGYATVASFRHVDAMARCG